MPVVIDPPVSPPVEPPADDGSNLWELLYEALNPLNDPDPDDHLLKFCQGVCAPMQPAYDLVRERDDMVGWSIAFDVDEAPAEVLPFLAQHVGVVPTPEMTEEQLRNEIREPTGWTRGQSSTVIVIGQRGLTGSKRVILRERTPSPGHCYIRTLKSETPDEAKTYADLRWQGVPAWEVLDYAALDGVTWADVAVGWEDWADVASAFDSWADLADLLPSELPEP